MSTEKNMLDALIQHQVYSYRASTKIVNELLGEYTKASNKLVIELKDKLDNLTQAEQSALLSGKYTTDNLKEIKQVFDDWYDVLAVQIPESFAVSATALAVYEAGYMASLYGDSVDAEKIAKPVLNKIKSEPVVSGMRIKDIWSNVAEQTRSQALYAVRDGIQQGVTTKDIVKSIRGERVKRGDSYEYVGGIINAEKRKNEIETNIRTIRSVITNDAYSETFKALGFTHLKFISTIDLRTSKECASLDQTVWEIGDPNIKRPPRHYNCRSVIVGVDESGKMGGKRPFVRSNKSVKDMSKDEREGNIGQIDANESFPKWLDRQPEKFQREYFGETKFKLYKDGGYSIQKFVEPVTGREYTIAELRALDQKTFRELNL